MIRYNASKFLKSFFVLLIFGSSSVFGFSDPPPPKIKISNFERYDSEYMLAERIIFTQYKIDIALPDDYIKVSVVPVDNKVKPISCDDVSDSKSICKLWLADRQEELQLQFMVSKHYGKPDIKVDTDNRIDVPEINLTALRQSVEATVRVSSSPEALLGCYEGLSSLMLDTLATAACARAVTETTPEAIKTHLSLHSWAYPKFGSKLSVSTLDDVLLSKSDANANAVHKTEQVYKYTANGVLKGIKIDGLNIKPIEITWSLADKHLGRQLTTRPSTIHTLFTEGLMGMICPVEGENSRGSNFSLLSKLKAEKAEGEAELAPAAACLVSWLTAKLEYQKTCTVSDKTLHTAALLTEWVKKIDTSDQFLLDKSSDLFAYIKDYMDSLGSPLAANLEDSNLAMRNEAQFRVFAYLMKHEMTMSSQSGVLSEVVLDKLASSLTNDCNTISKSKLLKSLQAFNRAAKKQMQNNTTSFLDKKIDLPISGLREKLQKDSSYKIVGTIPPRYFPYIDVRNTEKSVSFAISKANGDSVVLSMPKNEGNVISLTINDDRLQDILAIYHPNKKPSEIQSLLEDFLEAVKSFLDEKSSRSYNELNAKLGNVNRALFCPTHHHGRELEGDGNQDYCTSAREDDDAALDIELANIEDHIELANIDLANRDDIELANRDDIELADRMFNDIELVDAQGNIIMVDNWRRHNFTVREVKQLRDRKRFDRGNVYREHFRMVKRLMDEKDDIAEKIKIWKRHKPSDLREWEDIIECDRHTEANWARIEEAMPRGEWIEREYWARHPDPKGIKQKEAQNKQNCKVASCVLCVGAGIAALFKYFN